MPAASWVHRVDRFTFQFWRGAPPERPQQLVETYSRAGVSGTGLRVLGERGTEFDVELVEHFPLWAPAQLIVPSYQQLVGQPPVEVWFERVRLLPITRTLYAVLDVRQVQIKTNVRLIGPNYNYPAGVELVTRWQLLPVAV